MSARRDPPGLEEISAYVDGELDATAHAAVQTHLTDCPGDAARVAAYRQQDQALRHAFECFDDDERVKRLAHALRSRRRTRRIRRLGLAVAAVCVVAIASVLWWQRGASPLGNATVLASNATQAYKLYARSTPQRPPPSALSRGDALDHWLSTSIGHRIRVPDLGRFGYRLVKTRVLPGTHGTAAQLVFEDRAGHKVACYFTAHPDTGDTPLRYRTDGRVTTFYRIDDAVGYAVSGDIDRGRLREIAQAAYRSAESRNPE